MSLADIVQVSISVTAQTASRAGFGVPMLACYHVHFVQRVREYSSLAAMTSDGFHTDEPAYLMAATIFGQTPRVSRIKVGRRDGAPAQVVDLVPAAPSTGKVYTIKLDGVVATYTALVSDALSDVCTNLSLALNTATITDVDSIITNVASSLSIQTLTGASLNGVIGAGTIPGGGAVEIVLNSHADWDATTAVITGTDSRGAVLAENLLIPNGGAATVAGVKQFFTVVSVYIPAQSGTNGTATVGTVAKPDRGRYDAIIENGASTAGIQTLITTSLDGYVGVLPISPPKRLVMETSAHADWDATTAVVTGLDADGVAQTENLAIANGGGTVVKGLKLFSKVTQVVIPAQTGTNGKFILGTQARFLASGASGTKVVVTTTHAGQVLPFDEWTNPTEGGDDTLALTDQTADPATGIATDLAVIYAADKDWYGLLLDSNSNAQWTAAAAWVEANRIIAAAQNADAASFDSGSTTDLFAKLDTLSYARTSGWYHPSLGVNWLAAGVMGKLLPTDPGSETWAFKTIAGVAVYPLTATKQTAITTTKHANVYVDIAGTNNTWEGTSGSGEYIDTTRFVDWLQARLQERIFNVLRATPKLPYTDASVLLVVNEILSQLGDGVRAGGLAEGTLSASGPRVADVAIADRQARRLPDLIFAARLAGAVHTLEITGSVSV